MIQILPDEDWLPCLVKRLYCVTRRRPPGQAPFADFIAFIEAKTTRV